MLKSEFLSKNPAALSSFPWYGLFLLVFIGCGVVIFCGTPTFGVGKFRTLTLSQKSDSDSKM